MSVLYNPGKANVVSYSLSRMTMGSVSYVDEEKKDLAKEVHRFAKLVVRLDGSPNGGAIVHHNSYSSLKVEVMSKQHLYQPLMELEESVLGNLNESFSSGRGGVLRYQWGLCVPDVIVFIHPYPWLPTKPCMVEGVGLL